MKLFTKVMAAALLSTAISGAVMAAVDLSKDTVIADAADLKAVRAALGVNKISGLEHEITFDEKYVDSIRTLVTTRFTGQGRQAKNLIDGVKAIYADLEAAAGDDAKLKTKLGTGLLKGKFTLVTGEANSKWNDPANEAVLKKLREAVADNPFAALEKEAEVVALGKLKGKPSETKATEGSTVYKNFGEAEVALEAARTKKDPVAGQKVIDELKKMTIAARDGKKYNLAAVVAYEDKIDWATADLRASKKLLADAKQKEIDDEKAKPKKTAEEEVAIHFFKALQTAIGSGAFNALEGLPEATGLDLEDPASFEKSTGAADKLLGLIIAGGKGFTTLTLENTALKSGSTSGGGKGTGKRDRTPSPERGGGSYPTADLSEIKEAVLAGGNYDQSTGILTYQNLTTKQFPKS